MNDINEKELHENIMNGTFRNSLLKFNIFKQVDNLLKDEPPEKTIVSEITQENRFNRDYINKLLSKKGKIVFITVDADEDEPQQV